MNCKHCRKNVNEKRLDLNVCLLSQMIFKVMLMTQMLELMKVYFTLLYVKDANECPKMLLNVD